MLNTSFSFLIQGGVRVCQLPLGIIWGLLGRALTPSLPLEQQSRLQKPEKTLGQRCRWCLLELERSALKWSGLRGTGGHQQYPLDWVADSVRCQECKGRRREPCLQGAYSSQRTIAQLMVKCYMTSALAGVKSRMLWGKAVMGGSTEEGHRHASWKRWGWLESCWMRRRCMGEKVKKKFFR